VLLAGLFGKAARAAGRPESETRSLGLACTAAMTAILLHSLADFNLYIPANAMALSWITGIAAGLEFSFAQDHSLPLVVRCEALKLSLDASVRSRI
jgi:hypothetical protein